MAGLPEGTAGGTCVSGIVIRAEVAQPSPRDIASLALHVVSLRTIRPRIGNDFDGLGENGE